MTFSDVFQGLSASIPAELLNADFGRVVNDSRLAAAGTLFVAASGYGKDPHEYIPQAYSAGCRMFAVDPSRKEEYETSCPGAIFIPVDHLARDYGRIAENTFGNPSKSISVIGITGTSGKTTTAFVVYQALLSMGVQAGLIGTVEYRYPGHVTPASNTTPDAFELSALLAEMRQAGVETVVMEVSSHALAQGRVGGISFRAGAFTNFSQDHLDFHHDMHEYLDAKLSFIERISLLGQENAFFLYNADIPESGEIEKRCQAHHVRAVSFSAADQDSDYRAVDRRLTPEGSRWTVKNRAGESELMSSMPGMTNIYNFTMAFALLSELGFASEGIVRGFPGVRVPGRMEKVDTGNGVTVVVDYAHKPEALEKALNTLREAGPGKLITVFGCGGDRDRLKRPLMGGIAERLSDIVVLTSDNPRTEDPECILDEIQAGMTKGGFFREADRAKAIRLALSKAQKGDIVLIAGKGHEDYQIIGKEKRHFSDREEVMKAVSGEL